MRQVGLFTAPAPPPLDARRPIVVAFGGGLNSTGLLCGWTQRGLAPVDLILFADTGGERPEVYRHIEAFSAWLLDHGQPGIVTVRTRGLDSDPLGTLEAECLRLHALPSLAYGYRKCSEKYKVRAQHQAIRASPVTAPVFARRRLGEDARIVKIIGYDVDERRRADKADRAAEPWLLKRYPLVEWGWGRDECAEACRRAGFSSVAKSSCFFCPATTKPEIRRLAIEHPDLYARALAMEAQADLVTVRGLGRRFAWRDVDVTQPVVDDGAPEIACGCYDGEVDDEARDPAG